MLWTFGCSHTQGHGLPDCVGENNLPLNKTSELAWPVHLAELLQEPLTNISHAGVGIKSVWHSYMSADIKPGDIAVIMWPCWESRIDVLVDPDNPVNHAANIIPIRNWQTKDEYYFNNYYSRYDQWINWNLFITHAEIHRQLNQFQLIQTTYTPYKSEFATPEYADIRMSKTYFGHEKYCDMPRASDGTHNGEAAHAQFAQDLFGEHYI